MVETSSRNFKKKVQEYLLILRAQVGDDSAFEYLFDVYNDRLLYYLCRLIGEPTRAEDVLQNVWLRVYRKIGGLRNPRAFRTWLYRIARNEAISLLRKSRLETVHLITDQEVEFRDLQPAEMADPAYDPEDVAELHLALDRISQPHREVLTLRYLEGLSYEEMAEVIGCQVGTVRSRLHYAKCQLQKEMQRRTANMQDQRREKDDQKF